MDPRPATDDTPGPSAAGARPELSEREREILILVATGASNKQIAQQLVISPNTVKVHVRNIFSKIGVASRTEAALFAVREGLVKISGTPTVALEEDAPAAGEAPATPAPPEPATPVAVTAPPAAPAARWGLWLTLAVAAVLVAALSVWAIVAAQSQAATPTPTASVPTLQPRWTAQTGLPTPRAGLAVTTYENQIYAIGGEAAGGVTGAVERFDPATGQWKALADKPQAVADVNAAVIGGQIYVPGGRLASGALSDGLAVYHPATDEWDTRADLPVAVSGYALVAFEGQLYLFGGWDGTHYLDQALAYDPGQDAWRALPAMPTARAYAGAAVAGGLIYVVGGEAGAEPLAVNEVFQPQADKPWHTGTPLPEGRTGLGLTSLADGIYAVGGHGAAESWVAWSYQSAAGEWRPLEAFAAPPTTRLGLAAVQSKLYALGGEQAGAPTGQQLSYQAIYTTIFPGVSGE